MNSLTQRLLLFFIGFPLAIAIPVFLPYGNQLAFCLIVMLSTMIAAVELSFIFKARGITVHPVTAAITGFTLPMASWLIGMKAVPEVFPGTIIAAFVLFTLGKRTFASNEKEIVAVLPDTTAHLFILMYPAFLSTYLIRIAGLEHSTVIILAFYALSFGNDSAAYVTGMLFGRKRNIVPVSPNKSIAGFAGGFVASIVAAIAANRLFPEVFPGNPFIWAVFGACVGAAVIVGDLAESAIKRSAGVKDSGSIVPGRGGMLDSIDSLLFSGPVFFYLYVIITRGYA